VFVETIETRWIAAQLIEIKRGEIAMISK